MERDGQLVYTRNDSYGIPERMDLKKGTVIGHRDGFGFCPVRRGWSGSISAVSSDANGYAR